MFVGEFDVAQNLGHIRVALLHLHSGRSKSEILDRGAVGDAKKSTTLTFWMPEEEERIL